MLETLLHKDKAPPREQYSRPDICDIVKPKRLQARWRWSWRLSRGGEHKPPRDVPCGHLAVVVGEARRRFVVRTDFLNHPVLRQLLDQAYEEYGHAGTGPLAIPCDEFFFADIIHSLKGQSTTNRASCSLWLSEIQLPSSITAAVNPVTEAATTVSSLLV